MLRIVHPAPQDQGPPPPKRRSFISLALNAEETRHTRATLRALSRAYGTWGCLAEVMGVPVRSLLSCLYRRIMPGIAIRAAKAAGMSVDVVLNGNLSVAGRCPNCGSRVGDRPTIGKRGKR